MVTDLEDLGQAMKRAQYRNHRTMDAALQEIGVSLVQWDALRAVERMPGASAHDLAVATFQSDQSFGTLASRLLDRGLIARSPGHGRRIEHRITEAGRTALEQGRHIAIDVLSDLFAPLPAAARATLLHTLRKLVEND